MAGNQPFAGLYACLLEHVFKVLTRAVVNGQVRDTISWFGDTGRIALLFSLAGAAFAVLAVAAFLVADRVSMTAAARTAADE